MDRYIKRLIRCGYSADRAYCVCFDFAKNLPLIDLEYFIESIERETYVDRMESEPCRSESW